MVAASPSSQASSADIVSVALHYVALSQHGVNDGLLQCPEPGKGQHKARISACAAAGPGGVCARGGPAVGQELCVLYFGELATSTAALAVCSKAA